MSKTYKIMPTAEGEYSASKLYDELSEVQGQDGLYRSKKDGNIGHPLTDTTWWAKVIDLTPMTNAVSAAVSQTNAAKAISDGVVSAEQSRASAESARATAESTRSSNEQTRQSNEQSRQSSESGRVSAESSRVSAESARVSAEQSRATAEAGRVATFNEHEQSRQSAESGRVSAESSRVSAESARVNAEAARVTAENTRVVNEQSRETAFAGMATTINGKVDKETGKGLIDPAPVDGKVYGRKNGAWDSSLESKVSDLDRDFGKYADMADKTLTLVNSGKRFDSTGALVDATGWAVGKLGAVVVGNTYELKMESSAKMVLGTALFIAHTTETIGTETKDVYTPLFSAKSTDIPASGYVCLEAMKAYEEVLVSYRTDVTGANVIKVRRYGTKASIATQMSNMQQEIERKTDMNGLYDGLTAGAALRLVPHGEAATKEVIGLGGRKSGGKNAIDADINARISCIKGYTLMWRQQIPDGGTSGLEGGKITIGGTYSGYFPSYGTYNRPYLVFNPTDTAAEGVIEGVTVAAGWSVVRVGTEQDVAFAAGWKLIDLLLTFGTEKGHGLNATADVAEAMGYVATESGKTAFDAWMAHTEQFAADMAYSAQTVIRNGRWDGLRSVGKDGDGNAFDFTRSFEQARRQHFPEGIDGIPGTDVYNSLETTQAVRRLGVVKLKDLSFSLYSNSQGIKSFLSDSVTPRKKSSSIFMHEQYIFSPWYYTTTSKYGSKISYMGNGTTITITPEKEYANVSAFLAAHGEDLLYYELAEPVVTPLTELNLTYPVSNTEGTETPVCEPSTNCSPLAANITYGLDAYATIVDLKKRVEALEKK